MPLDRSFDLAKALCADVQNRLLRKETEQDARVQLINRFLTEVLEWPVADIRTEPQALASPFATTTPGIFAVGDVRSGSVKRVASGVGEGSVVVQAIHQFLNSGVA
jgi:thioredoxin reductase (NADPH)